MKRTSWLRQYIDAERSGPHAICVYVGRWRCEFIRRNLNAPGTSYGSHEIVLWRTPR